MVDELFMQRCLELAEKGAGFVAPNPMVGSVIVHKEKIIGEGYHEKYGQAHAEVNAIESVQDKSLLKESTIYVNLEPCAHFGKTPPCSNLIIESEIPRVVIGCIDSYAEVAGKGIERMRAAGIEVQVGILEKESLQLNRRFFTFHSKKRPYIILKWAQTKDGFIDKQREVSSTGINWITQVETKQLVHKWRHEEAGILIGKNTVINDNPALTCREFPGKNPIRIVVDPNNELDLSNYQLGSTEARTIKISGSQITVEKILNQLYQEVIQSVIIEGGAFTINEFIKSDIWDEARILEGIGTFNAGLKAPILPSSPASTKQIGKDKLSIYYND